MASVAGLSGTEGRRWARISAARIVTPSLRQARLPVLLLDQYQNLFELAQIGGWLDSDVEKQLLAISHLRHSTDGKPLGKIWSPPLVSTVSPTGTCSSLITRSSTTSPFAVPRSTPCRRVFSRIAPTPLL